MDKTEYRLDKALIEKKITLFTNLQMGFVGAALMLMMMDLSKIYLLAPAGAGLILASWYKSQLSRIYEEFKHLSVSIAPKSILVRKSENDIGQRITFREIQEATQHRQHFLPLVTLYLNADSDKIELFALEQASDFTKQLNLQCANAG